MNSNMIALVAHDAKRAADEFEGIDEKIEAAMKASVRHWMVTDEDTQFKGAVAGLYSSVKDEQIHRRIEQEIKNLRNLSALTSGVPVDMERMLEEVEEFEPLGLAIKWHRIKEKA